MAEAAVHPTDPHSAHPQAGRKLLDAAIYFMCDDVRAMVRTLEEKNAKCAPIEKERWGLRTAITLPSGGQIALYQPTHPTALDLK